MSFDAKLSMRDNIESILESLNVSYTAEGQSVKFEAIRSVTEASEKDLTFCYYEPEKAVSLINNSRASDHFMQEKFGRNGPSSSGK